MKNVIIALTAILFVACSKSNKDAEPKPNPMFTEYYIDGVKCVPENITRQQGVIFSFHGCGQTLMITYDQARTSVDTVAQNKGDNKIAFRLSRGNKVWTSKNTGELVKITSDGQKMLTEIPKIKLYGEDTIELVGNVVYDFD